MALIITTACPEVDLEPSPSLARAGHQFANNIASGHARQHNGDVIHHVTHTVNYIIVADSGIDVIERGTASPEQIVSLKERLVPQGLTVKEDTASMIAHWDDSSSIRTTYTDTCSKLSMDFDFDRELCVTNVYDKQLKSLFKRNIRSRQISPKKLKDGTMKQKSSTTELSAVDEACLTALPQTCQTAPGDLENRATEQIPNTAEDLRLSLHRGHSQAHALLVGNSDNDRAAVMNQLHSFDLRYHCNSRTRYRPLVYQDLIHHTKLLIIFACESSIKLDDRVDFGRLVEILDYSVPKDSYETLDGDIAKTVVAFWGLPALLTAVPNTSHRLPSSTLSLIDEVARIAAADYVPTEADVTRIQARDFFTITSHVDLRDDRCLSIRVTNVGCQKRNPKSLIRPLLASSPPTDVVILCVNLARYDQAAEANEVLQSLEYLSLISHLRTTRNRKLPIILLLTHERDFREKLSTIPLARCFPKYRGGHDFQRATEHVIKRFRTVVHGQYFFPRVAGVNIEEDIEFLLASIKAARPCITSRKLAEAGFL